MNIKETIICHRMKPINIHKNESQKIEEIYIPVERLQYNGIIAHPMLIVNDKEFVHHSIIVK